MRVTLELDDKKYGCEFDRMGFDDENFAAAVGKLVEDTVLAHLGYMSGMARIEE